MATRASSAHWIWRDLSLSFVVLALAAFSCGLIIYFSGWNPLQPQWTATQDPSDRSRQADSDELYTGSVIMVPSRGDQCAQRMFDNRTGRMWENGYISCDEAMTRLAGNAPTATISSRRMRVISNAFRGE